MANLKEIRSRITSIGSTMQITSAMKMVSASKLKRAQDAIMQMRPYAEKLSELIGQSFSITNDSPYAKRTDKPKKVLVVAATSNKGLAGAFNANVVKQVNNIVNDNYKNVTTDLFAIGKKGADILKKNHNVVKTNHEIYDSLNFKTTEEIAQELIELYTSGQYDQIIIVYNSFKNAGTQIIKTETFLPLEAKDDEQNSVPSEFIYEPSKELIMKKLIPLSLKVQLLKVLRDSLAAEHGARMTAMHKATDNAKELQAELKLSYNKARQASITGEIIEIVGGANALQA